MLLSHIKPRTDCNRKLVWGQNFGNMSIRLSCLIHQSHKTHSAPFTSMHRIRTTMYTFLSQSGITKDMGQVYYEIFVIGAFSFPVRKLINLQRSNKLASNSPLPCMQLWHILASEWSVCIIINDQRCALTYKCSRRECICYQILLYGHV